MIRAVGRSSGCPTFLIKGNEAMKNFMSDDFLLQTETAKKLYAEHAAQMPIFDYHCHLPPQQIADDIQFKNITQAWLNGDH